MILGSLESSQGDNHFGGIEPNDTDAFRSCEKTYRLIDRYKESPKDLNKSLNNAFALRKTYSLDRYDVDFNKLDQTMHGYRNCEGIYQ
ncbi:hypothetical protein C2G38_2223181 [Gigaspora rosea]|uniref:Uncharacterized protein n=1 Tax=Gigaspora rosea TaxID=44941 RepID=A0A397U1P9_9GLOM|nr:hypothetical protein C2G38_2223181 [Gigaspora rosea]